MMFCVSPPLSGDLFISGYDSASSHAIQHQSRDSRGFLQLPFESISHFVAPICDMSTYMALRGEI